MQSSGFGPGLISESALVVHLAKASLLCPLRPSRAPKSQSRRKGERSEISDGTRLWSQDESENTAKAVYLPQIGALRTGETVKIDLKFLFL